MAKKRKAHTSYASFKEVTDMLLELHETAPNDYSVTQNYSVFINSPAFFKHFLGKRMPVRADCARVAVVREGWFSPTINGHTYHCKAGELLFVNWGAVIEDDQFSDDLSMDGYMLTEEFVNLMFGGNLPPIFKSTTLCFKAALTKEEYNTFYKVLQALLTVKALGPQTETTTTNALFVAINLFTQKLYESDILLPSVQWSRNQKLTEAFTQLVNVHAKTQHSIGFYAKQLCVSAHHLSMVVRKETGSTAKEWIDRATVTAIQVELKYSEKTLEQISHDFSFPSLSTFCKFFKRNTGTTAFTYRAE